MARSLREPDVLAQYFAVQHFEWISGAAGELRCGNETRDRERVPARSGQLAIIAAIGNGRCSSEGYAMRIQTLLGWSLPSAPAPFGICRGMGAADFAPWYLLRATISFSISWALSSC